MTGCVQGATNADPIVIHSTLHGIDVADAEVFLRNIGGNLAANGPHYANRVDADHFRIDAAGSGDYDTASTGTWDWTNSLADNITDAAVSGVDTVRIWALGVNDLHDGDYVGIENHPTEELNGVWKIALTDSGAFDINVLVADTVHGQHGQCWKTYPREA